MAPDERSRTINWLGVCVIFASGIVLALMTMTTDGPNASQTFSAVGNKLSAGDSRLGGGLRLIFAHDEVPFSCAKMHMSIPSTSLVQDAEAEDSSEFETESQGQVASALKMLLWEIEDLESTPVASVALWGENNYVPS